MSIHSLIQRFVDVPDASKPMVAARDVLDSLRGHEDEVAHELAYLTGTGGNALQSFYRTPNLSLLKVSFPNGRRTPPHNHGTWAAILVLSGSETNFLYRRLNDGSLERAGEVSLERGSVLPMAEDIVHVVECVGDEPAVGLHVYGADVLGVSRQMWDPDTLEEYPLDWNHYEGFAQRASAASHAPLST